MMQVKYAAKAFGLLKGPELDTEKPPETLPLKNSNPRNFCVKTVNPINVALNKITYTALIMRLVSRNVSIIAQKSNGNLPHLIKSVFKLLPSNGPLLNNDKPIKKKNSKRNKSTVLLDFRLEKSGERIFLSKKKTIIKPAHVPINAIEIGIKNITP